MENRTVTHGTYVIERSYPSAPERVFAAFADPAEKRRWLSDSASSAVESFELEFRVGGTERALYRLKEGTPFPGVTYETETTYQDIVPARRIVFAYTMTFGGKRISASLGTVEFLPTETGTDLIFTEQGAFFEGADGPKMREAGWRELLERVAKYLAG